MCESGGYIYSICLKAETTVKGGIQFQSHVYYAVFTV